jgi:poly(3-hydroxybutyrate) depolymerase
MWKICTIFAGFAFVASASAAQPQCNDRDHVLELLAKKYKEAPIAAGVTNSGGLVEVLSNGRGGTWTIIVTTPQGMSCLVAAGEGWRSMEQIALEPEA